MICAPQTTLWGGPGPRIEHGTGDLEARTLTTRPPHLGYGKSSGSNWIRIHNTVWRLAKNLQKRKRKDSKDSTDKPLVSILSLKHTVPMLQGRVALNKVPDSILNDPELQLAMQVSSRLFINHTPVPILFISTVQESINRESIYSIQFIQKF